MKSLGMVRAVDALGRIVLPIEIRRSMGLETGDGLEMYVEKERIILQKYAPACIFCGEADEVITYKDKKICKKCLEALKSEN